MPKVTAEQLQTMWNDNLKRLPATPINNSFVPEATKRWLTSTGLPVGDERLEEALLITFYDEAELLERYSHRGETYLVIGDDGEAIICVAETDGAVSALSPAGEVADRFLNSSVEQLLVCLGYYLQEWNAINEGDDKEVYAAIQQIKSRIHETDAAALKADSWWDAVIEDKVLMTAPDDELQAV